MGSPAPLAARPLWAEVLPPQRDYVALPPGRDPVVIAEKDAGVMRYVRRSLLALPPRTGMPPLAARTALAAASQVVRMPAAWALFPKVPELADRSEEADSGLASWLAPEGRRLLVLHHSRDADAGVVMLLFDAGMAQPSTALKIADSEEGAVRIDRERVQLRHIRQQQLGPVLSTVPELLPDRESRFAILPTKGQPGTPMLVAYHRPGHIRTPRAVHADFRSAGRWLAGLQATATGQHEPLAVAGGCEAAATQLLRGDEQQLDQVLTSLAALRARLRRHVAALTVVHGDFWPGNALVEDGLIVGVVDWERAEAAGSPVRDLARFAVAYSLYLDRHTSPGRPVRGLRGLTAGAPGAGVLHAVDGTGWFPVTVRRYLRAGLARVGLPDSVARDAVQSEVASSAAEATDPDFARSQWALFLALERTRS